MMVRTAVPLKQGHSWGLWAARALALLWGGWWTFFGIASGLGEGLDPLGVVMHTLLPGLICLGSALIAWRWLGVGGALLVLEGAFALVAYPQTIGSRFPLSTVVFVLLTLAAPPLVAGLLFLREWRRGRATPAAR